MGSSAGKCEMRWCFQEATELCRCGSVKLCRNCVKTHIQMKPEWPHELVHLTETVYSAPRLTYGKQLYRTPEGSTEIYEGYVAEVREKVAIKVQYCKSTAEVNEKQEEAALQRSIRHQHICRCVQSFLDPSYTAGFKHVIVMEYGELGDMEREMERRKETRSRFSEGELMDVMFGLTDALAYLEGLNIAHRDVKPCNILLFPTPKLADFGLTLQGSSQLRTQSYQVVGTVLYLSPALKQGYLDMWEGRNSTGEVKHNPFKSDVYSLGLTFLALATLEPPSGLNSISQGTEALRLKLQRRIGGIRYSGKVKQVLNVMLEPVEDLRPSFRLLLDMMKRLEFTADTETEVETYDTLQTTLCTEVLQPSIDDLFRLKVEKESGNWSREVATMVQRTLRGGERVGSVRVEKVLGRGELGAVCWVIGKGGEEAKAVELEGTGLGDEGIKELAAVLPSCPNLATLSLGHNSLTSLGIKALSPLLPSLSHLLVLRLWRNPFTWEGCVHLSLSLAHCISLQELYLGETMLGPEGARFLAKAVEKLGGLKILSLTDNGIGDEGLRHICPALKKAQGVQRLYLDGNGIGSTGANLLIGFIADMKGLVAVSLARNELFPPEIASLKACSSRVKLTF